MLAADFAIQEVTAPEFQGDYGTEETAPIRVGDKVDSVAAIEATESFHYWADGTQISLTPTNEIIVGKNAASDVDLSAIVQSADSPALIEAELFRPNLVTLNAENGARWDSVIEQQAQAWGVDEADLWSAPVFESSETGTRMWVTDQVIVSLDAGVNPEDFFSGSTFDSYRPLRGTTDQFVATISEGGGMESLRLANDVLPGRSGVRWATVNFVAEGQNALIPNDPSFSSQWHLDNDGQTGARSDADGDFEEAWNTTIGDDDVIVAIVDSGVQTNHPDINMWSNPGEIAGDGIDNDGNGWVDDVNGLNLVDGDANANDPNPISVNDNHGTAVAGVAGARGNNSLGVAGGSYGSKIMALKPWIENANGSFSFSVSDLTESLYYLSGRTADGTGTWRGADVSNHSYTVGANTAISDAFNWSTSNGRNGLGTPAFVATGNGADAFQSFSYNVSVPFNVFNEGAQFQIRYSKDSSVDAGDDAAWFGNVRIPGIGRNRFDTFGNFEGWTTSGDAPGVMTNDPSHQYGTGRNILRMGNGDITHNQSTSWFSPEFEDDGIFSFNAWVSSEASFDGMEVLARFRTGVFGEFGSWQTVTNLVSGVPNVTSQASYPANLASTIGVGASTDWDYRSAYSQYGAGLDFVAPSGGGDNGLLTLDRTGGAGYASGDTAAVSGTSFASPLAAATAALLISNNPDLSAADLRAAMQSSADQEGGVTYTGDTNFYYGHGRLDSDNALINAGSDSNDTIAEAPTISRDTTTSGRIGASDDVDIYEFSALAGDVVAFDIDNDAPDSYFDSVLRLFNSAGVEVGVSDDDLGPAPEEHFRESYLEYTVMTTGTYYVGVSSYNNFGYDPNDGGTGSGGSSGNYELHFLDADANDQISEAVPLAVGDTSPLATISSINDVDMYSVDVVAGQFLGFDIDNVAGNTSLDTFINIFDSSGNILTSNDDGTGPAPEEHLRESYVEYTFDTTGTYYVGVSHWRNTGYNPSTGEGDSGVGDQSEIGQFTLAVSDVDANDQISEASPLAFGSTSPVGTISTISDVDMYSFDVVAGQLVGFDVDNVPGNMDLDTYLTVFDSAGNALTTNDNGTGPAPEEFSGESYAEFTFSSAGTYYVGVSHRDNTGYDPIGGLGDSGLGDATEVGQFTLTITDADFNDQFSEANSISPGSNSGLFSISSLTDVDMWEFNAAAGQQLGFDVDNVSNTDLDSYINVFDSAGNIIAFNDDGVGPAPEEHFRESYVEHTFGTAGTYYVGVSHWENTTYDPITGLGDSGAGDAAEIGGFTLTVTDIPTVADPDFNNDGFLDGIDIDMLQANMIIGPADPATFDITGDGLVDINDRNEWLDVAGIANVGGPYLPGDANLSGFVDGADFLAWNTSKFTNNTAWTAGDFTADGVVDGADFLAWNTFKFQGSGPALIDQGSGSVARESRRGAVIDEWFEDRRDEEYQQSRYDHVDAVFALV